MKYFIQRTQTYSGDTLWPNLPEKKKFELVFIQDFLGFGLGEEFSKFYFDDGA
jgi:hypothetical protein